VDDEIKDPMAEYDHTNDIARTPVSGKKVGNPHGKQRPYYGHEKTMRPWDVSWDADLNPVFQ